MTEEEAKTKWCPMVRVYTFADDDYPKRIELMQRERNEAGNHCIGSACMMWRWAQGAGRIAPIHDRPGFLQIEFEHPGAGYCGLAGKP